MSSWGDSYELKVKTFDKTEQEIKDLGYRVPDITYKYSYEEYYPQTLFSWDDTEIQIKNPNSFTKFTICNYFVLTAIMGNLEKILVDGRNAPYEETFNGHYIDGNFETISYIIEQCDKETGDVLFRKEIDTYPNIVHDVKKYEEEHNNEFKLISDKNEILKLIELNPRFYNFSDETIKEDKDLAFKAVKMHGANYKFILDKYKQDKEFQLAAITKQSSIFLFLPKDKLNNYDFLLEICKCNQYCIEYISDQEMKNKIKTELEKLKTKVEKKSYEELPF